MDKTLNRIWVQDIEFDFEDGVTLYAFIKSLEAEQDRITRELGVGINRAITISLDDNVGGEPKLVLSIYKSEGGF